MCVCEACVCGHSVYFYNCLDHQHSGLPYVLRELRNITPGKFLISGFCRHDKWFVENKISRHDICCLSVLFCFDPQDWMYGGYLNTDPYPKMWTTHSPITFIPYCVHCIKGAVEKDNSKGIEEGRNNISTRLFVNLVFLSAFPHHRHHHHHNNYSQFIHMDYHLHSLTIFFSFFHYQFSVTIRT